MRRKTSSDRIPELPKGSRNVEVEGAGCLVVLGLFGLPLILLFFGVLANAGLASMRNALDTTNVTTLLSSFSTWMHRGGDNAGLISLCWVFAVGYCALLWQWIAFVKGWRKGLLRPPLLWALSSIYFTAATIAIAFLTAQFTETLRDWAKVTVVAWLVPGAFLFIVLPLWWAVLKPPRASP